MLLERGAAVDALDADVLCATLNVCAHMCDHVVMQTRTPLCAALEYGGEPSDDCLRLVSLLIDNGADVNMHTSCVSVEHILTDQRPAT